MDFFRRLLGSRSETGAPEVFQIRFAGDQPRPAVRVSRSADPQAVIAALDLPQPTPTILISGGADSMDAEAASALRSIVEDGLVRFVSRQQISLIDGGTASGVMRLIGDARQRRSRTFPLIGVAPEKLVGYPGADNPGKLADLDANHSHFVLTSGDQFGAESEMIVQLAYALSGSGANKRLAVIANGGEIVKKEAHRCATREPRFPLLVLEGSGRFADQLAAARASASSDALIQDILDQGIVHFIPLKAGADNLYRWLENFFGY